MKEESKKYLKWAKFSCAGFGLTAIITGILAFLLLDFNSFGQSLISFGIGFFVVNITITKALKAEEQ